MKRFLTFLLGITVLGAVAQDSEEIVKCHTYEMTDKLIEEHPEIIHVMEAADAELEQTRRTPNLAKDGDVYTIPVVFHIVHNYGEENISFEQIQNAIDVMNEDFSAQNADAETVNPAFDDLVANVGIRFALAQRDPDGNCTNGVVRTVSALTNQGGENLKEISPIWDRSRYMNIWVCKTIASGAAGYTYYPSTLAGSFGETNDGIVVRSDYVGRIGTSNWQRSQTLTHEVGHWIDLPHLWGSTNSPEEESNCNTDDGVSDTPNTIGWTSCTLNGESCGSLDNVENYMEYSFCGKMFTLEQSQRMRNALESSVAERSSLWQEENLAFTGVDLEPEICAADFTANKRVVCVGETINFTDLSYNGVQGRTWIFEGGEPAGSTEPTPSVTYTEPGTYAVSILASDGNDQVSLVRNDFIRVLDTANTALPFFEGFEEINQLNSQDEDLWFTLNNTGGIDWEITDQAAYQGEKSVYLNGYDNEDNQTEYLYSQTFDLSGLSDNAVLSFEYACARRGFNTDGQLRVWITKNCGEHWSIRETLDDDELFTVTGNYSQPYFPESQDEWRTVVIDNISSVFANSEFRIRFEYLAENGNNLFIDNINLIDGTTLSLAERNKLNDEIKIYPNPSRQFSTIEFDLTEPEKQIQINLIDLSGRLLNSIYNGYMPAGNQRLEVDLADLEAGVYLIQFNTGSGSFAKKIIKKN
jgi:PKD repeat protein